MTDCPICGGQLQKGAEDYSCTYKGKIVEVKDFIYFECMLCGEDFNKKESQRKLEKKLKKLREEE